MIPRAFVKRYAKPLAEVLGRYQAAVLGCGLGQEAGTVAFVRRLLHMRERTHPGIGFLAREEGELTWELPPLVLDADALSALAGVLRGYDEDRANCSRFGQAMLVMLTEANLGVTARLAGACLVPNTYDCHTLVELWDAGRGQWVLSDPTFGLAPRDAITGSRATLATMGTAARARDWSAIGYDYLTAEQDRYAREYYLDYPLLFVHPMAPGQSKPLWGLTPVDDLYERLGSQLPGGGLAKKAAEDLKYGPRPAGFAAVQIAPQAGSSSFPAMACCPYQIVHPGGTCFVRARRRQVK